MIKVGRYFILQKNLKGFDINVRPFIPSPNESDYKRGYITRYFCQKSNDENSVIYEISKKKYQNIKNNSFLTSVSIDWRITGDDTDIKKSNSESIRLVSNKMKKLKLYLPNLLQFKKKT